MTNHILSADDDTLPILAELLNEKKRRYPLNEVRAMFGLLNLRYAVVSGQLMKELLKQVLK